MRYLLTVIYVLLLFNACSPTRRLQKHDRLFTGTDVSFTSRPSHEKEIREKLSTTLPVPNTPGILNIRTGFYNLFKKHHTSGIRNMIQNGLGSKPKLFNENHLKRSTTQIKRVLQNYGYFNAAVSCDTLVENREVGIHCNVDPNKEYSIDSIIFLKDTLDISADIKEKYRLKYIRQAEAYDRNDLFNERNTIVNHARNIGYINVGIEDIIFHVDTTTTDDIHLYVDLKESMDTTKYMRFITGKIYIDSDYSLSDKDSIENISFNEKSGFYNINSDPLIRASRIKKTILMREGKSLGAIAQRLSIARLLKLGVFRFVNLQMKQRNDTLDQYLYLTRNTIRSISAEAEINNRSGSLFGAEGNINFSHKNIFHGAEELTTSLKTGIEINQRLKDIVNSYYFTGEVKIVYPQLLIPFVEPPTTKYYVPKTITALSTSFNRRLNFYSTFSQQAKYGFLWKENSSKTHEFNPIDWSYNTVRNQSQVFLDSIAKNPRLAKSFQDIFITGLNYSFTYENSSEVGIENSLYQKATIETSGNMLRLLDFRKQGALFGTPYAQYVRLTNDTRKYWKINKGLSIATRFLGGIVYAYGNSVEPPFNKQFSIGGANSLRAFSIRSIGPGSFYSDKTVQNTFWDQTGDLKLEGNIELRFPIYKVVHGAAFLDMGNIWYLNSGADYLDFRFKDFYKKIAIGTGFGLRFDFSFLVFRTDFGIPVRQPTSDLNFKWTIQDAQPFQWSWLRNNVKLNLGLGYPF